MTTITAVKYRLVMRGELLKMFRISATRLVQLTTQPEYGFPEPVAEPSGGKIWDEDEVLGWAEQVGRAVYPLDAPSGE